MDFIKKNIPIEQKIIFLFADHVSLITPFLIDFFDDSLLRRRPRGILQHVFLSQALSALGSPIWTDTLNILCLLYSRTLEPTSSLLHVDLIGKVEESVKLSPNNQSTQPFARAPRYSFSGFGSRDTILPRSQNLWVKCQLLTKVPVTL